MNELVNQVERTIAGRRLLRRGEKVLVAVSGGLDSMVLLRVMSELAKAHQWKLAVAHFNHRLRGRSSDGDERLVSATAKRLKLAFVSAAGDVRAYAREHGLSLEMAGRKLRHEFLAKTAREQKIKTIALAHHGDDQVELFFLRLFRGAGSEGLAGMKWRSASPADGGIFLIRPMLDRAKSELKEFAKEAGVVFREDATNAQLEMQRNRIRRELIPMLTRRYQPALRRVVLRAMEVLGAEGELVESKAREWLAGAVKRKGKFGRLPVALQREVLREQLRELGVGESYGLIEELREAGGAGVMVREGLTVERDDRGRLQVKEREEAGFGAAEMRLRLGEKGTVIFGKRRVWWDIRRYDNGTLRARKGRGNCEYFDVKKTGLEVILRYWRAGDRFQPLGMKAMVKLQDLFVNQKIPRAERHRRIVATTDKGEIFWVEGLRMAERFKLEKNTERRLKWQWQGL